MFIVKVLSGKVKQVAEQCTGKVDPVQVCAGLVGEFYK